MEHPKSETTQQTPLNGSCNNDPYTNLSLPKPVITILRKDFNGNLELKTMQEHGDGDILASPTLMTIDGQEAYITVGNKTQCFPSWDKPKLPKSSLELKVTPTVMDANKVKMEIIIKRIIVNSDTESDPTKHEYKFEAIVEDGETIMISEVYTDILSDQGAIFGDLPWAMKKHNQGQKVRKAYFFTPHIVK